MPSGKTHDRINLVFLPVFLIVLFSIGFTSITFSMFFALGFVFGTYMFSPDLDTYSKIYKRWGILRFIWYPYRKIFPHRSVFTHGLLIGDIIRLIYLALWLIPSVMILNAATGGFIMNMIEKTYPEMKYAIWFVPIGVVSASIVHIMSDVIGSSLKKMFGSWKSKLLLFLGTVVSILIISLIWKPKETLHLLEKIIQFS